MQDTKATDAKHLLDAPIWVFDLDNTLYHHSCNLFAEIDVLMGEFIADLLGMSMADAKVYQKQLFHKHGTSAKGLLEEGHIETPHAFLDYVHNIDYSVIPRDTVLDNALSKIKGEKYILTNGTQSHAMNCLDPIGIAHHFATGETDADGNPTYRIFDVLDADMTPKPHPDPYDMFLQKFDLSRTDIQGAIFADDITKNLDVPNQLGMQTIWIDTNSERISGPATVGDHIHHKTTNLSQFLHELVSEQG